MNSALKVVEIMWLVIAAVSIYEVFNQWGEDSTKALIFGGTAIVGVLMYFFRRKRRLKYRERNQSN